MQAAHSVCGPALHMRPGIPVSHVPQGAGCANEPHQPSGPAVHRSGRRRPMSVHCGGAAAGCSCCRRHSCCALPLPPLAWMAVR